MHRYEFVTEARVMRRYVIEVDRVLTAGAVYDNIEQWTDETDPGIQCIDIDEAGEYLVPETFTEA